MAFDNRDVVYLAIKEYTFDNGDENMNITAFATLDKCKDYVQRMQRKHPDVNTYYVKSPIN